MKDRIAIVFPRKMQVSSDPEKQILRDFDPEYKVDIFYYTEETGSAKKVNKGEITLDKAKLLADYKVIMPVDSDVTKYLADLQGGIQKFNAFPHQIGQNIFVPVMNPHKVSIYPLLAKEIRRAFDMAFKALGGEELVVVHEKDYQIFEYPNEVYENLILCKEKKVLLVDLETSDLHNVLDGSILGISFGWKDHMGYYGPWEAWDDECFALLEDLIRDPDIFTVCHNLKFEMKWLYAKLKINPFSWKNCHDTMAMKYCDDENAAVDLKSLAVKYTDLGNYEDELDREKKLLAKKMKIKIADFSYAYIPIEILGPYACKDIDATGQIFKRFFFTIKKYSTIYNYLIKWTPSIAILETIGGYINIDKTNIAIKDYDRYIGELEEEMFTDPNVIELVKEQGKPYNPRSVPQTRKLLFEIAGLPVIKTTDKDNPNAEASTDAEVLEILAEDHDFALAKKLMAVRRATKFRGTYLVNIRDYLSSDKRIRTSFNITKTSSGRLSSSGTFNFQNIPRGPAIKQLFTEEEGYGVLQMDLATAEVWVAAAQSKDEFLISAFESGMDFHGFVAKEAFGLPCHPNDVKIYYKDKRQAAKAITFGILFGAQAAKIASEIGCTKAEAQELIDMYFSKAWGLKEYIDNRKDFIVGNAYTRSIFGRTRRLPEVFSAVRGIKYHAINSGFNFEIQSPASDINVDGFNTLTKDMYEMEWLGKYWRPFTLVHDSILSGVIHNHRKIENIIYMYAEAFQRICREKYPHMPVPIGQDFEYGKDWGHVAHYKTVRNWVI